MIEFLRCLRPSRRGHSDWSESVGGRTRFRVATVLVLGLLAACGDRRDISDMSVGVAPFERLRGMDLVQLRSGGVRALRASALPAPLEGLRELIGEYDVLYGIPGFEGADGSWPNEDALVASVEAVREWPTDALAESAWRRSMRELEAGFGVAPQCATFVGPRFELRVAEWEQGGGWSVAASYSAAINLTPELVLTARQSVAVRREALTAHYPMTGARNAEELPSWTSTPCSGSARADSTAVRAR